MTIHCARCAKPVEIEKTEKIGIYRYDEACAAIVKARSAKERGII